MLAIMKKIVGRNTSMQYCRKNRRQHKRQCVGNIDGKLMSTCY